MSSAPPLPLKSSKSLVLRVRLLTRTSRRHDDTVGTMPPRSGQCGLWCRHLGFSAADACKVASLIEMGIM
jgi:hypothetical protein